MKVVCVNNIFKNLDDSNLTLKLTIDKVYDVSDYGINDYGDECYVIINDIGEEEAYTGLRFRKLDDVRNEKIAKLLENDR